MCVMSLSVMPYLGDRSHIVSVTMMEVPTEKGEGGKRGKLELYLKEEHEERGLITKSSSTPKGGEWVSLSQTRTHTHS